MKKLSLYFFIVIISGLFSCGPEFYRTKYCPVVSVKDSTHKEVKDSLVKRDSALTLPGEVIKVTEYLPCPDIKIEKKGKKGSFKIEIKDSSLTGECIIDTAQIAFDWIEHHKKEITNTYHSEVREVVKKAPKTGFQRFKDWWFYVTASLILIRIAWWILRKYPIPLK